LLNSATQIRQEGPLGSGGSATVFKGVLLDKELIDQHKFREIAIKKINKNPNLTELENRDRFLQEISIMWSCTFHTNIIKIVGYTLEPEFLLVTKLYEIDLFTLIHHPNETIVPLLALKLVNDIAAGMFYCEQVGIVHRDLKSSNVLLEQVPLNERKSILKAVVCDFGLARVTSSASPVQNLKMREIAGFSPRYAAPEVLENSSLLLPTDPEIDKKSDVYSLGVIIWELLVRDVPWKGLTRQAIETKVRSGERLQPPDDDGKDQAKTILIDLMTSCFAQQPNSRPSFYHIHTKLASLL